jgi:exopolyphosphatase/guanosine-5'-triphosphate,3'-diphosphate pyrophosphatase
MKIEKYAAIDIGSNALRTLIANVIIDDKGNFNFYKNSLVRVPIRLGQDTFTSGEISKENIKRIVKAVKAFKNIIKIHNVTDFNAYATSALREAKNSNSIVKLIQKKTGIKIDLIDGKKEASLISSVNFFHGIEKKSNFLYVDVGGGSTEFSVLCNGERIHEKSFKVGTVRLLNNIVKDDTWSEIKNWVTDNTFNISNLSLIGTGGNINKIHKISSAKDYDPISYYSLSNLFDSMNKLTYKERIIKYQLNPDRADVILPALSIYLKALKWSGSKKIYVPKIGLSDGMIQELFIRKLKNKSEI